MYRVNYLSRSSTKKRKQNISEKTGSCKENRQNLRMSNTSCIENGTFLYMTQKKFEK
jgi:hypothetical protein